MKKKLLALLGALLLCVVAYSVETVPVNGINYFINSSTSTATVAPKKYSGDVVIPESFNYEGNTYTVTAIQGRASSMVAEMEGYDAAFRNCTDLTSVTIPKTLKTIGKGAFEGCSSLKAVYISDLSLWCSIDFGSYSPGSYSNDPRSTNPLYYAHDLYLNGEIITDLVIPEDVTETGLYCFVGGSFKSVTFGKGFKQMGDYSFGECNQLTDVYSLCSNVNCEPVSNYFSNPETKTLHIRERYKDNYFNIYQEWDKFGKVEYIEGIDYHLIYVVDEEEYQRDWLEVGESITPAKSPTKEGYTFSGWSEIPETMPDRDVTVTGSFTINTYKLTYKVDGEEYKVVEVKYGEAITAEPEPTKKGMTFSGWSEIPEKMPAKDVDVTGTFSWSKVTKDGVIYQVYNAEDELADVCGNDNASGEVKIPSSMEIDGYIYKVTSVSDKAFYQQSGITNIEIGENISSIGVRAFAGIDKLTDVAIYAKNVPETDRTAFENSYIEDYVTLHVPDGCVERYKAEAPWKNFKAIEVIPGTKVLPAPAIGMKDGKLTFTCEEEGVEFHYEITPLGQNSGKGNDIVLSQSYRVKVYASKEGCQDSETTTKEIAIKKGDVNCDGSVNAADVVSLTIIIMSPEAVNEEEAETEEETVQ